MARSATEQARRKRISEALLAERLGLNEPWIERWEEDGSWQEKSIAPGQIPAFIREKLNEDEFRALEHRIDQLVAAGCRRPVVYFCLLQLSPRAEWIRTGGHLQSKANRPGEDTTAVEKVAAIATREELQTLASNARAMRNQVRRFSSDLTLVAEASGIRLPRCLSYSTENVHDALDLAEDSLAWISLLAEAYAAPMATTLLKGKGVLYITLYASLFADQRKLHSARTLIRDSRRATESTRARSKVEAPGNVLAEIVSKVKESKTDWSASELKNKLALFEEMYPRLYKRLKRNLRELHEFAGR